MGLQVNPGIGVERRHVAPLAGGFPHALRSPPLACKPRTENHVVWIVPLHRGNRRGKILLRRETDESGLFGRCRLGNVDSAPLRPFHKRPSGRMSLGKGQNRVPKSRLTVAAAPPGQLIVKKISKQPRIIAVRSAFLTRNLVAPAPEIRVKRIGHGRAGASLVRADIPVAVLRLSAKGSAKGQERSMDESAMPQGGVAARPEQIKAPFSKAGDRLVPPRLDVRICRAVVFAVPPLRRTLCAAMSTGLDVVNAQDNRAAPLWINHPPPPIGQFLDTEEPRRP